MCNRAFLEETKGIYWIFQKKYNNIKGEIHVLSEMEAGKKKINQDLLARLLL